MYIEIKRSFRIKLISISIGILYIIWMILSNPYQEHLMWINNETLRISINTILNVAILVFSFLLIVIIPTQKLYYENNELKRKSLFKETNFPLHDITSIKFEVESWISRITTINIDNKKNRFVMFYLPRDEVNTLFAAIKNDISLIEHRN